MLKPKLVAIWPPCCLGDRDIISYFYSIKIH